jgi:hypothetical protein
LDRLRFFQKRDFCDFRNSVCYLVGLESGELRSLGIPEKFDCVQRMKERYDNLAFNFQGIWGKCLDRYNAFRIFTRMNLPEIAYPALSLNFNLEFKFKLRNRKMYFKRSNFSEKPNPKINFLSRAKLGTWHSR